MKFCSECAYPVALQIPEGDNRPRYVCAQCETIHYHNPKLVVGSIPVWDEDGKIRVLLCKRAIEPRHGYWTLPAGFMELGETVERGAARETEEEAGAHFEMEGLFTVLSVVRVGQIHLYFRARLLDTVFAPGHETIEAKLFSEAEVPWEALAFHTVRETLRHYFEDRRRGRFDVHVGTLD